MRTDEIRDEAKELRRQVMTVDQKIEILKVEALCELNSTLMFIKNNLK